MGIEGVSDPVSGVLAAPTSHNPISQVGALAFVVSRTQASVRVTEALRALALETVAGNEAAACRTAHDSLPPRWSLSSASRLSGDGAKAIEAYVDLVKRNSDRRVSLRYLTAATPAQVNSPP